MPADLLELLRDAPAPAMRVDSGHVIHRARARQRRDRTLVGAAGLVTAACVAAAMVLNPFGRATTLPVPGASTSSATSTSSARAGTASLARLVQSTRLKHAVGFELKGDLSVVVGMDDPRITEGPHGPRMPFSGVLFVTSTGVQVARTSEAYEGIDLDGVGVSRRAQPDGVVLLWGVLPGDSVQVQVRGKGGRGVPDANGQIQPIPGTKFAAFAIYIPATAKGAPQDVQNLSWRTSDGEGGVGDTTTFGGQPPTMAVSCTQHNDGTPDGGPGSQVATAPDELARRWAGNRYPGAEPRIVWRDTDEAYVVFDNTGGKRQAVLHYVDDGGWYLSELAYC